MKFENKGKWLKQIVEAKGVTINGTDDIELDFDTRQGLVYITINGDLTYKVDEDKFMNNVSDFVYDEVDKDKTKFNLNWDKHFGKLNRYLRKVESSRTNEDTTLEKHLLDVLSKEGEHTLRQLQDFENKGYSDKQISDCLKKLISTGKVKSSFYGGSTRYKISESSETADLKVLLDLSLSEENKAVADYEARALKCERHGNLKAAKLFHELAKDERVHVAQLTEAKKLFELNDPTTDEEGSQEAKEILLT